MKTIKKAIAVILTVLMAISMMPFTASANDAHVHNSITFTEWSSTDSMPTEAGNYYLTADVTLTSKWNVPSGITRLCLNGHTVTQTGNDCAIFVDSDNILNLYDEESNQGAVTGGKGYANSGIKSGGNIFVRGTFNMYGGTVTGGSAKEGAGITVSNGEFNMYGGEISGNTTDLTDPDNGSGGGICAHGNSIVTIKNGTITNNQALFGGGLYGFESSIVSLDGGSITENSAEYGGGVCVWSSSSTQVTLYLTGSEITNNNAIEGGGILNGFSVVNLTGGTVSGNTVTNGCGAGMKSFHKSSGKDAVNNLSGTVFGENDVIAVSPHIADTTALPINITGDLGSRVYKVRLYTNGRTKTTPTTGVITNGLSGNGTLANFVSDNGAGYALSLNNSGEAQIVPGHTITWKNYDGTTLKTENVADGSVPAYNGETPTRPEDETNTYTFSGWNPTVSVVTGEATYVAQFTQVPKFSVFVKKLTGGTITVPNVTGLTTVAQLKDLLVTETGVPASAMRLIFAGKQLEDDKTLGEYNIQKESTIHLVIRTYTITWKSDEATIIDTTNVAYGETPTHEDPADYEDADYTYEFAGWTPEIVAATGEATYTATYTATPKATVSFTKVTDASQITAENISTCTADEAKAFMLANWDELTSKGVPIVLAFYTDTDNTDPNNFNIVIVDPNESKDYFSENFEGFLHTGENTSGNIANVSTMFGYGFNVYLCTPAAPAEPNNGTNITVADTISENFYLDGDYYGADAYVTVNYNHNSNLSQTANFNTDDPQKLSEMDKISGGVYDGNSIISVIQAPAQSTEPITINVYASQADAEAGTNPVDTITYSVYSYCREIIEGTYDDDVKDLARATLDYAAAAQNYFEYNQSNMATKDNASNAYYGDVADFDMATVTASASAPDCIEAFSVVVKSDLEINLLSRTPINVTSASIDTTGTSRFAAQSTTNGDWYVVHISGIEPANMDNTFTVVTDKGDIVMSANAIMKLMANSNDANLVTLAKAMYLYGAAANTYFANQN